MTGSLPPPLVYDGVAVPPGRYTARGASRARFRATLGLLILGLGVGMAVLAVWDHVVEDASRYACPPDCGRPPAAAPVANMPRFVAPDGSFSVGYPAPSPVYAISTQTDGVTATLSAGDGGVLRLFGQPARGQVARQVVTELIRKQYPNAEIAYELPNAMVGYQVGYGVVANFRSPGIESRSVTRVVIMAAVKDDLALIGIAEGPFRRFTAEFGPGPPSAANLEIAMDMGKYVESFVWGAQTPQ